MTIFSISLLNVNTSGWFTIIIQEYLEFAGMERVVPTAG